MAKKQQTPSPFTVCVASFKGGGGKSTLTANIAVSAQQAGMNPAVIDADPTVDTSTRWSDDRLAYIEEHPEADVAPIHTVKKHGRIGELIREMSKTYSPVIVDTGGRDSRELRSALAVVDLVLNPLEPTQEGVDTTEGFLEVVENARDFNPSLRTVVVFSRAVPNAPRRIEDALAYLEPYTGNDLTVADSVITNRVAYADSRTEGLAVSEWRDDVARQEVAAFTDELFTMMTAKKG